MSDGSPRFDIENSDGPDADGYGRLRIAAPQVQFAAFFSNTSHPLLFNTSAAGAGTVAFNSTIGSARLSVGTNAADSIIVQSKRYLRYNPGTSYSLGLSGIIGPKKSNVRQRWGYFDGNNGAFFEQTGTDLAIVMRTNTSGSPVDTRVLQANWNLDRMDGSNGGNNPSGVNLDTSKQNLYIVDYVWQGAGITRVGVMISNRIVYVHQFSNSNTLTAPYWRSPSLPGRTELSNTATSASTTTLDLICVTALRETETDIFAPYTFSASMGVTKVTVSSGVTLVPLISIRPKATFNGLTNRVPILPTRFETLPIQDSILVKVILNGTLTGASFASVNANSAVEFDTASTAIAGGTVLFETYSAGGGKGIDSLIDLQDEIVLGLDIAGSVQDTLTIAALKVGANADTLASFRWEEFQ